MNDFLTITYPRRGDRHTKPTGVLVIAMFYFLSGATSLAASLWLLMASLDTSSIPLVGAELARYILMTALIAAAVGAVYAATGWGLWHLKQWAQAAAIAVGCLALLGQLAGVIVLSFGGGAVPIQAYLLVGLYAAVSLGMIAYLAMPATGVVFRSPEWVPVETSCPHCMRPGIVPGMSVCPFCQLPLISTDPSAVAGTVSSPAATRVGAPAAPVLGWLIVKTGSDAGKRIDLRDDIDIGRDVNSQLSLHDDYVSRQHARVKLEGGQFFIYDVGSRTGTFVNGHRVQRLMLYDGAEIRLGSTTLEFKKTHSN